MNGGFGGKSGLVGYCGNRVGLVDCSWVRPLLYPPGVYIFSLSYMIFRFHL